MSDIPNVRIVPRWRIVLVRRVRFKIHCGMLGRSRFVNEVDAIHPGAQQNTLARTVFEPFMAHNHARSFTSDL